MNAEDVSWPDLERLRRRFLDGTAGRSDYWQTDADLAGYDATFAQRIGWKWDFVLADLEARGWRPPPGDLLDWGCGSGIATRAFLDRFGEEGRGVVRFYDRSARAMDFAAGRARTRFPRVRVETGPSSEPAVLLVSHVLTELEARPIEALLELAGRAQAVLWVEPGTHPTSRVLGGIRERLLPTHHAVAPCPHQAPCGVLAPGNEPHWCHQFAAPPPEVHTDPFWARFGRTLAIDLRSVPLSYLVMDRRPPRPVPAGVMRLLGRPDVFKAEVRFFACDASGVCQRTFTKREAPVLWRTMRKDRHDSLLDPSRFGEA